MTLEEREQEEWHTYLEIIKRLYGDEIYNQEKLRVTTDIGNNTTFTDASWNAYDRSPIPIKYKKHSLSEWIQTSNDVQSKIQIYKKSDQKMNLADQMMNLGGNIYTDDDIYIDCRPTDILGERIESEEENQEENLRGIESILDDLTNLVRKSNIDSIFQIGIQLLVALILLYICYYVGKKIFIKIPDKIINKTSENALNR